MFKDKKIFNLDLKLVLLMMSLGTFIHLILDALLIGYIMPLYPFIYTQIGLNIVQYLPLIMIDHVVNVKRHQILF